jgi:hypothetical protein
MVVLIEDMEMNKVFKPFKFYARKKEEGLSAIEIVLIVLAGLILLAGALVVYHRFTRDNEVSDGVRDLMTIVSGTQAQYQGQAGFSGIDNALLVDSKVAPSSMDIQGTSTINDPWGGPVNVAPATVNGAADSGFSVTYTKVPESACNAMGKLQIGGMQSVTINNGSLLPLSMATSGTNTPSAVDSDCKTTTPATLMWTFN